MKYLVLKSESSIKFFPFDSPGDSVVFNGDKRSNVPYYVRECVTEITGIITVNQISNYATGDTLIIMTHAGCNIRVDDELLPQGTCEMTMGKKYVTARITLFLINEEERSDVQDAFDEENEVDFFDGENDNYCYVGEVEPIDEGYDGEETNWDDQEDWGWGWSDEEAWNDDDHSILSVRAA